MLACVPFAPQTTLLSVRSLLQRYPQAARGGRLASGLNPGLAQGDGTPWVSPGLCGLDQGIVTLMVENHRSGLVWRLMRQCPYLVDGLRAAGFRGGWLDRRYGTRTCHDHAR